MYRKSVQDAMENNSIYKKTIDSSQFLTRLVKIPVVNSAITVATDIYGKAKNSGGLVGRTIGIAERASLAAAGQVLPLAQRLTPLAAQPLNTVDALADRSLEKLEIHVPSIKKQPLELVSDTKELLTSKTRPAVARFNSVSETILSSRVAQLSFDIFDHFLNSASTVVDHILPAADNEKPASNGAHQDYKTPEEKSARLGYLFHKALFLATNTARRLLGLAQSRVDSAVQAKDTVVKSARKILNNSSDSSANNSPTGGKGVQNGPAASGKNKNKSQ